MIGKLIMQMREEAEKAIRRVTRLEGELLKLNTLEDTMASRDTSNIFLFIQKNSKF